MQMLDIRAGALRASLVTIVAGGLATAGAQGSPTKIPVRQLGAPIATSTELLGNLAGVRALSNGNVLINDQARRRVIMLDAELKLIGVAADSTSSTANAYGPQAGGLVPYRADSTLFVDAASLSMLVIDPAGKIARVIAAPRPSDVRSLTGGGQGNPSFDPAGRLVYRAPMSFGRPAGAPGGPMSMPDFPDSVALVRFDLTARKLDTAAFFKVLKPRMDFSRDANGGMRMTNYINPLPIVDDWAVLSDGTIAIVRGRDYHVDFYGLDGAKTSAPKIAYDWQRLTDDDKSKFIDSTKSAMERVRAQMTAGAAPGGAAGAPGAAPAGGGVFGGGGGGGVTVITTMRMDGPPPGGALPGGGGQRIEMSGGPGAGGMPALNFVSPNELPDYKPVFGAGAVRADMDGRIWVRTIPTKPTPGGAIYDVVDRSGAVVDRLQVPAGAVIAGFGPGSMVYLATRDASGIHLSRALAK